MRRPLTLAAASLAFGVFAWFYRGPGWGFVRHTAGDVAAAVLLYALGWAVLNRGWRLHGALALGGATLVELVQLTGWVDQRSPAVLHAVFGSTFDWADLVAYAVGALVGIGCQRWGRAGVASASEATGRQ